MCISIHVHAVPVLLHFVIVLCLCECVCAEEGREKTRKEHPPLILCLAHFPCLTLNVGVIMAYGSTPYVGMTPKKNGGHIKVHK